MAATPVTAMKKRDLATVAAVAAVWVRAETGETGTEAIGNMWWRRKAFWH
jgi:hypothetical protein